MHTLRATCDNGQSVSQRFRAGAFSAHSSLCVRAREDLRGHHAYSLTRPTKSSYRFLSCRFLIRFDSILKQKASKCAPRSAAFCSGLRPLFAQAGTARQRPLSRLRPLLSTIFSRNHVLPDLRCPRARVCPTSKSAATQMFQMHARGCGCRRRMACTTSLAA